MADGLPDREVDVVRRKIDLTAAHPELAQAGIDIEQGGAPEARNHTCRTIRHIHQQIGFGGGLEIEATAGGLRQQRTGTGRTQRHRIGEDAAGQGFLRIAVGHRDAVGLAVGIDAAPADDRIDRAAGGAGGFGATASTFCPSVKSAAAI